MNFTVVRAVREAESTASEPAEKLQKTESRSAPARGAPMDLPFAERVLRLNFDTADSGMAGFETADVAMADFAATIPGDLP